MIASTSQIGDTPGPSFTHGHGALNGAAALDVILDEQFFQDELSEDRSTVSIPLELVSEVDKLRVCLSWIDPPAEPGAARALVNDLDLRVVGPDGETTLPWRFGPTNNPSVLGEPFHRGKDDLNVNEVVEINTPAVGDYQLIVSSDQPLDQRFSVAYHLEAENETLAFTFPENGDFVSTASILTTIHWEGSPAAPADLQWRLAADGEEWETVAAEVALTKGVFSWAPPAATGPALLRFIQADGSVTVSDTFLLAPPLAVEIVQNCGNDILADWQDIGPDFEVQLWRQDNGEMMLQDETLNAPLEKNLSSGRYQFRAVHDNGMEVTPSEIFEVSETGDGCYLEVTFVSRYFESANIDIYTTLLSRYKLARIVLERRGADGTWWEEQQEIEAEMEERHRWQAIPVGSGTTQFRFTIFLEDGTVLRGPIISPSFNFARVEVFPNPAGRFVQFSSPIGWFRAGCRFTIINSLGQAMKSRTLSYRETQPVISLDELPNGLYTVRYDPPEDENLDMEEEVQWIPLVIQK